MASWQSYNLGTLFPQQVSDAVTAVSNVSSQISNATSASAGALNALSNIVVDVEDPLKAAIDSLIQEFEDSILDLLDTGIYLYWDVEGWPSEPPQGFVGWSGRFLRSFDDPADINRPIFSSSSGVGAIVLLGGANTLGNLMPILHSLGQLFGIKSFVDAWTSYAQGLQEDTIDDIARGVPLAPDWHSYTVSEAIPPLARLGQVVSGIIDNIRSAGGASELLQDLADALQAKAARLTALSNQLQLVLAQLASILSFSGLQALSIESTTGIEGLKSEFVATQDPPSLQADSYIAGVCLLAGNPGFSTLQTLFAL